MSASRSEPSSAVRWWFTAAAALTLISLIMGSVVAATKSGFVCPTWPGCYNERFLPTTAATLDFNPVIEFTHRVLAGLTGPTVLVCAILAQRLADRRLAVLQWSGLVGTLGSGIFGMLTVLVGISWWLSAIDLTFAFVAVVATLVARLLVSWPEVVPSREARPGAAALVLLWLVHMLGLAVAGTDSYTSTLGWPLGILAGDRWAVVQGLRLVLVAAAVTLIVTAVTLALRGAGVHWPAWLVVAAVVVEIVLWLSFHLGNDGVWLRMWYAVAAALVFWTLAVLVARSSVQASPIPQARRQEVDALQ